MNRLLPCAACCLLALFATVPALAQDGPWADVPDSPHAHYQSGFAIASSVQQPSENVIWSLVNLDAGMGMNTTKVMSSTDNGATWRDSVGFTSNFPARNLWALDGQRAWLIMGGQTLWQTSTGPTGFKPSSVQVTGGVKFIRFFTPKLGILVGQATAGNWAIYRTTDGGDSWQLQANTPSFVAGNATQCTVLGTTIWVVTSQGKLLHSSDAGLTWTSTTNPTGFSQISFRDAQHGLAYGPRTAYVYPKIDTPPLYRTADGGNSWKLVTPTGPAAPQLQRVVLAP